MTDETILRQMTPVKEQSLLNFINQLNVTNITAPPLLVIDPLISLPIHLSLVRMIGRCTGRSPLVIHTVQVRRADPTDYCAKVIEVLCDLRRRGEPFLVQGAHCSQLILMLCDRLVLAQ